MNGLSYNERTHPKITSVHQQRLALIYVRQSTQKQVNQNQESQQYQYRLQLRAQELGWPAGRVRVIDSDLGLSGSEASGRSGFQELVAEVSLGHAGIVFGYEVSRLARNNADWYHLLDLAAVFGTLIADNDGIYDPRLYNDRLLLGLKGTMSEAELHLLRQRLDAGRMNQVKRNAYRQRLPTGYLRLVDGGVVKDPDDQVRHVIELTFAKFEELSSANKVMLYLRQQGILFPRRQNGGPQANQLLWKVASESAVTEMLQNPAYAGAFAYGRRQNDPTLRKAGRKATGNRRKPMSAWLHLQQNVYPAYITWEQYLANQDRIQQNGLRFVEMREKAQGIVREGPGLLQGLVICGNCGHHMQTVYKPTPRYVCRGLVRTTIARRDCNSVRAHVIDDVVAQAFFEVLQPAQLDALEAILASQRADRSRVERQWQDQLKRAQYEAHQAQRQYDAVDPENRLVAGELERRWETKLQQLRQTEEDYHHFLQVPLPAIVPPELRNLFQEVSSRLPELWPALSNAQKKELLRSLIQRVIIRRPATDQLAMRIVWISGHFTDHTALTPIWREQDVSRYDQMVDRVHALCQQGYKDKEIARQLTEEGFHTARSPYVTPLSVSKIRLSRNWHTPFEQWRGKDAVGDYWTVNGLRKQLETNESTIYRFIYRKIIPTDFVVHDLHTGVYLIRKDEQLVEGLRQRIEKNKLRNGMSKSQQSVTAENLFTHGGR
jgi:DNA invertase Pin-like site-specific DNA recombinase